MNIITMIDVPDAIKRIHSIFKNNGYKLYIVGGAVRDMLLGKTPHDYDLVTDCMPSISAAILAANNVKIDMKGEKYGVIVVGKSPSYELATFRKDTYQVNTPIIFCDNAKDDVMRRDITINGLYYDISREDARIIDYVSGVDDLSNGIIRTIGDVNEKFSTDKSRILRSLRFAASLSFKLDPAIINYLRDGADLCGVSAELIRREFISGLMSGEPNNYLQLVREYNLFKYIFADLEISSDFAADGIYSSILVACADYNLTISILLRNNNSVNVSAVMNKLKYKKSEIKKVVLLIDLANFTFNKIIDYKKRQHALSISREQIIALGTVINDNRVIFFADYELFAQPKEIAALGYYGRKLGEAIIAVETDNFKKMYYCANHKRD